MVQPGVACIVLLMLVDITSPLVNNSGIEALINRIAAVKRGSRDLQVLTRRKTKTAKSTSSSGDGPIRKSSSGQGESLEVSSEFSISSSDEKDTNKDGHPQSSAERKGWRKWHRKCAPCPEEMWKKWRDPTIKWICGAYQRARRSFKSLCMMHYRNCQDGTMFIKIHDHRCDNGSNIKPHGDHFFYDYHVDLTDDSSESKSKSETSEDASSDSGSSIFDE